MRRFLTILLASVILTTASINIVQAVMSSATIDSETNIIRIQHGLPALPGNAELENLAVLRARQLSITFAHPTSWQWMFNAMGGCYSVIGENIAWESVNGFTDWPVSAWYASPEHRANMLGAWTYMASAVYTVNGRDYADQLFIRRCSTTPAPSSSPKSAPAPSDGEMSIPNTAMGQ